MSKNDYGLLISLQFSSLLTAPTIYASCTDPIIWSGMWKEYLQTKLDKKTLSYSLIDKDTGNPSPTTKQILGNGKLGKDNRQKIKGEHNHNLFVRGGFSLRIQSFLG